MNSAFASREATILEAIRSFESGDFASPTETARQFNIPHSTFHYRRNGGQDRVSAQALNQRLDPEQENYLANWIIEQSEANRSPTYADLREMATLMLRSGHDEKPLGQDWHLAFLRRNPSVKSLMGRVIDSARVKELTTTLVRTYFERLNVAHRKYNIKQANMWNMDEHGMGLGICTNGKVLCGAYKRRAHISSPQTSEWASIIECASATGQSIRPVVIFKGSTPQTTWFNPQNVPDWKYTASEKAWINTEIALAWLTEVFIPETKPEGNDWRMLILDNHKCHTNPEFIQKCSDNRIRVFYLPTHSSHVLQPLDLCFFGPLKAHYHAAIAKVAVLDDSAPVRKTRFVNEYEKARNNILDRRIVLGGWKSSGLYPWNPESVLRSDWIVNDDDDENRPIEATPEPIPCFPHTPYTPRKPKDVIKQFRDLTRSQNSERTLPHLMRKISKAMTDDNVEKVALKRRVSALELEKTERDNKRIRRPIIPREDTALGTFVSREKAIEACIAASADWKERENKPPPRPKRAEYWLAPTPMTLAIEECMVEFQI
jgi:hypothetical protein